MNKNFGVLLALYFAAVCPEWPTNPGVAFADNLAVDGEITSGRTSVINVLLFGADPSGVSDSTGAFNAAISAAKSFTPHRNVYAPAGTYSVSSLTLQGSVLPTMGLGMNGDGRYQTILRANTPNRSVLRIGNQAVVSGVGIDGRGLDNVTAFGFIAGNAMLFDISVDNCRIGLDLPGSPTWGAISNQIYRARIRNCLYGIRLQTTGTPAHWVNNNLFVGVEVRDCSVAGVSLDRADGNKFLGLLIEGNSGVGIDHREGLGNSFTGWAEKNAKGHLRFPAASSNSAATFDLIGLESWAAAFSTKGTINAGQDTLVVVDNSDIVPAKNITVGGAGPGGMSLRTTVKSVHGTTVTLDDAARTSVAGAPVTRTEWQGTQSLSVTSEQYTYRLGTTFFNDRPTVARLIFNSLPGTSSAHIYYNTGVTDAYEWDPLYNVIAHRAVSTGNLDLPRGTFSANQVRIGSGTTIRKHISSTSSLSFATPSLVPGSVDNTITIDGAAIGDTVSVAAPVAVGSNYLLTGFVSAGNTVTVRWTQISGRPQTPASGAYRADVWKH